MGKVFWTGGYRAAGGSYPWTGMWKWSDGSSFTFTNWGKGGLNNPAKYSQHFISSNWEKWGVWDDNDQEKHNYPFVCKCRYFI